MMASSYTEHTCMDPECEVVTVVRWRPATFEQPGEPVTDTCECGEDLDWDDAEPAEPPDDIFERADEAYERSMDR